MMKKTIEKYVGLNKNFVIMTDVSNYLDFYVYNKESNMIKNTKTARIYFLKEFYEYIEMYEPDIYAVFYPEDLFLEEKYRQVFL